MGLFDTIREKAAELLSGVTDKASDLAGDLPGAEMLDDLSQSATDAASQATDEAEGTVQDLGASAAEAAADATGAVIDGTDTVTGSFTDTPGEPPQP
jgi:vacuolar-type H+-ATPase subunit H